MIFNLDNPLNSRDLSPDRSAEEAIKVNNNYLIGYNK